MASQKQSLPSSASILPVLSILFYCAGFLRVELELNEQRKRINALENIQKTKPSEVPNLDKLMRNAGGKFCTDLIWFYSGQKTCLTEFAIRGFFRDFHFY